MPSPSKHNGARIVKMEPLAPGETWSVAKLGRRVEQLHECVETLSGEIKAQKGAMRSMERSLLKIEGALDVLRRGFALPENAPHDAPPPRPRAAFPRITWQVGVGVVAAMSGIQIILKAIDPLAGAVWNALPHVWKALIGG